VRYDHEDMSVDGWTRDVDGVPQTVADQSLTIVLRCKRLMVDTGSGLKTALFDHCPAMTVLCNTRFSSLL